jgi:hypothetical protein
MGKYHQGKYKIKNPHKYMGDINNIIYRSSWEAKLLHYLDTKSSVISFSSEEIIIPYISPLDGRVHRYFPDAWAIIKTKDGLKTYLIEVKPYSQTSLPNPNRKKTAKLLNEITTYMINEAKWNAAEEYCKQRNWKFLILTEKDIFG